MVHLLLGNASAYRGHVLYAPARLLNAMPSDGNSCRDKRYDWQQGDLVLHLAGGSSKKLWEKYWTSAAHVRAKG